MLPRSLVTRSVKLNKGLLTCRFYSDGSVGSQRPMGSVNEDYYVKQHEKELLKALKKQLQEQRDKLDNLENTINKLHE
ncbi:hypothetical protein C6P45_000685 [Maudiozyma exigua]|uniref:Mitochondrial ATPase inhibitor n=1 Tax=Maudiozyma exigua TaxID=34358 RepID=A0A9P6W6K0_MAUEX|nr:hypothetical protein C6P45_000685 [Kazachstania exigua]